eukprot:CAMPEP_0119533686 /NCGR_PEP_ID=MMETSP1344-20130328/47038_1 /TAXON_ID=236787 /ORGANISM="Florenciella parvula, Strain CCMP2471" /LENGTH=68 /DNA_ID=CAMNT_0007574663 /DNA_START=132 /DNA_END=335 /DNA_ORIENTATION=-
MRRHLLLCRLSRFKPTASALTSASPRVPPCAPVYPRVPPCAPGYPPLSGCGSPAADRWRLRAEVSCTT